tara:strand:+ start:255 stop:509 length:255 start_codon:yes stop_codon:yes gene_type:complete
MSWITGIEIEYNKEDDCYRYRFEELKDGEKQTVLSRQFSHWADCVELLHDKIMRWGEDNPTVADWNGDAAEYRFNLTDYYEGKQ